MNKWVLSVCMLLTLAGTAAAQSPDPATAPPPAATVPPPVVAPAPVVTPKPVEKPPAPKPVVPAKPAKPATEPAVAVPPPAASPASAAPTDSAVSVGNDCQPLSIWLTGFAMLLIGFAAGFIARHLVSRRKLGGMTVRIGTWRGIP